jgi:LPXTG-motif cell wall-anchored protein
MIVTAVPPVERLTLVRMRRRTAGLAAAIAMFGCGAVGAEVFAAATPTVTLPSSPGTDRITFAGHAPFNNGQANLLIDDATGACNPNDAMGAQFRDEHKVTVNVPSHVDSKYDVLIRFQIDWTPVTPEPTQDLRLDLFGPDGKLVASSDGSQTSEGISVTSPTGGTYDMVVCAFQTTPNGQDYTGSVTASLLNPPPSRPATRVTAPTYHQFEAPKGVSDDAGEPSIGNNWKSGNTFFTSYTNEYRVGFNTAKKTSTWTLVNDKTADPSNKVSLDPIGFTDSRTGRTFVSQLLFVCSGAVFTDDDFKNITPSEGCGTGINGFDHQTFGGGPYPTNGAAAPLTSYPHAVYYCSQAQALVLGGATCSRSDTGGLAFNPPVEIFGGKCNGLHGHVRVAPDGTVYVPNNNCAGKQGVAVSRDAGETWTVHTIPDSFAGTSDPSVSAGSDGTLYFGYSDGTGRAKIAVSRDRGATWTRSIDAGGPYGIRNAEFAEVIAGDGDRAAFAFLGTTSRGSTQSSAFGKDKAGTRFTGAAWHLYIATTYDRGAHWSTVDAVPNDPVQRGCIWNAGGSNQCRNLLDFNDITLTKTGQVMVGYADGCLPPALDAKANCVASTQVSANTYAQHGSIARQISGRGLFAAYDPKKPTTSTGRGATGSGSAAGSGSGAGSASRSGSGSLARTGSSPALPIVALGVGLLGLAGYAARRRRA